MGQPSDLDNFFKKYINTFAYFHTNNQKIAAINLLFNGYKILQGATIVKGFDIYKNVSFTDKQHPDYNILSPFINDSLMDDIRIITCFENYMKAILILKNYVVHRISSIDKRLRTAQQERPILISELFIPTDFSNFDITRHSQWKTNFQTLNFSWMLKAKYQSVIELPQKMLELIKEINEERNKLHFISVDEFHFGKPTIERYESVIDFAQNVIKNSILDLDQNMKDLLKSV